MAGASTTNRHQASDREVNGTETWPLLESFAKACTLTYIGNVRVSSLTARLEAVSPKGKFEVRRFTARIHE